MPTTRRRFLELSALVALAAAAGGPAAAAGRLSVVATTGMIADAARVIGADRLDVRALMGAGVDPHAYRQTRTDIQAMVRSDLVLRHGLYLEAQMEDFFEDFDRSRRSVAVAETIPRDRLLAHEDYPDRFDPHVWMDPDLWAIVTATVRDALVDLSPADRTAFETNHAAYAAEIAALSAFNAGALATVPEAARVLVTAHDAFNYFGRAYGFEVLGIQGISTESEAGLARIAELVDLLVERRIAAVFVETSVSDRNIRALIEGAAARGWPVAVGGELYSDAMGPPGSYEGTWLGMIDHNVTTIARALGGRVPERGRLGRLRAGA